MDIVEDYLRKELLSGRISSLFFSREEILVSQIRSAFAGVFLKLSKSALPLIRIGLSYEV